MQYVFSKVSVAPLRVSADHRAEMSSQFLFGETAEIIEKNAEGWARVKCSWDGYTGWVRLNQFKVVDEFPGINNFAQQRENLVEYEGTELYIPLGSRLPGVRQAMSTNEIETETLQQLIREIALKYLYTPYLWGGRSPRGIDCSGFVQAVFMQAGVQLKRDACLQADQGILVNDLNESRCGDLAFFVEGKAITHVGIVFGKGKIIHSSGEVRIDKLDETGIIHGQTGEKTHTLHSIRRIIPV